MEINLGGFFMHGDFRYNLIRFNLLIKGEKETLKMEELEEFLKGKAIEDITDEEVKTQLEHLTMENFLEKLSEEKYKITDEGKKEIEEVKKAIEKL